MKKKLLILLLFCNLNAETSEYVTFEMMQKNKDAFLTTLSDLVKELSKSEIQYSWGKVSTSQNSYNTLSYTLINEHQNISLKHINYSYKIDYTQSKSNTNDYSFSLDTGVGYNIVDISVDDYISIGTSLGFYNLNAVIQNNHKDITSYKIGAQIAFSKKLFPLVSGYGLTTYSKEYSQNSDGIFNEAKIGLRVKPKPYTNFNFTLGVKYYKLSSKALKIKSISNYLGVSYSF